MCCFLPVCGCVAALWLSCVPSLPPTTGPGPPLVYYTATPAHLHIIMHLALAKQDKIGQKRGDELFCCLSFQYAYLVSIFQAKQLKNIWLKARKGQPAATHTSQAKNAFFLRFCFFAFLLRAERNCLAAAPLCPLYLYSS